jgi:hypothetical protein
MGWAEGFEPSATGTTIRRSTKLSYAHREALLSVYQGRANPGKYAARAYFLRLSTSFIDPWR